MRQPLFSIFLFLPLKTSISFPCPKTRFYVVLWYNAYEKGERCLKKKLFVFLCLVLIGFVSFRALFLKNGPTDPSNEPQDSYESEVPNESRMSDDQENNQYSIPSEQPKKPSATNDTTIHKGNVEIDRTPDSYTVLVNKEYGLPEEYVPDDLVVPNISYSFSYYDEKKLLRQVPAAALEELVAAAKEDNVILNGVSGYRSYARQKAIYRNNIKTKGLAHTEQYSAKPGFSEHQSGLSIDISARSNNNALTARFGTTKEGIWLAKNCYKYGFIIRYPKGKEAITGYSYEPWHIRYVGVGLATYLTENNLTLEEYYGYQPKATIAPSKPDYKDEDLNDDDTHDLEEVPTATPKVYKATKAPTKTLAPTSTPKATKKPESPKVTSTPDPVPTPEVVATKKPTPTKKPTEAPVATKKPSATPKPTQTPVATEKPAATPIERPEKPAAPVEPGDSDSSDKNPPSEESSAQE